MGVRLYNPATGRFLSMDPVYGGNLNAYEYAHADPLNRFDLDGKRNWFKKQWNRFNNKRHRVGRNPNWRSVYWSGKFAISTAALFSPFGRARTVRNVWRAAKSPRKTIKRCGKSAGRFVHCVGAGWGAQTAVGDFRNWNNNRRFRNDWNDSLTHSGRRSVCRKYTGRSSCR